MLSWKTNGTDPNVNGDSGKYTLGSPMAFSWELQTLQNPKWNEQYNFKLNKDAVGYTTKLEFECFDHDIGADDSLGGAEFDFSKLIPGKWEVNRS